MGGRLNTPNITKSPHSPLGIEASKLPFLKLPSSSGFYMKQYHMKLIKLSEACSRIPDGYTFIYRLVLARGHSRLAMLLYTVCLALSRRGLNYRR